MRIHTTIWGLEQPASKLNYGMLALKTDQLTSKLG